MAQAKNKGGANMSYCRWSSDDFQCDIYCYESDAGFEIHVASHRRVFNEPLPPPLDWDNFSAEKFVERWRIVSEMVDRAISVPIGLPHDGESFLVVSAADAAAKLAELKSLGYLVPQSAIDELNEEGRCN
jgi:hypothetical protein